MSSNFRWFTIISLAPQVNQCSTRLIYMYVYLGITLTHRQLLCLSVCCSMHCIVFRLMWEHIGELMLFFATLITIVCTSPVCTIPTIILFLLLPFFLSLCFLFCLPPCDDLSVISVVHTVRHISSQIDPFLTKYFVRFFSCGDFKFTT